MAPKTPPLPMTATTPTHHHSKSKVATNNCILEQTPSIGFRFHMSLSFQFKNTLPMACRAQCCCCPGFPMPCNLELLACASVAAAVACRSRLFAPVGFTDGVGAA